MKLTTLYIVLLLFVSQLSGQNKMARDSIKYATEGEILESKAMNRLLKSSPLSYEHKVAPAISLSAILYPRAIANRSLLNLSLNLGIEGRYYYKMNRRVKSGKQASNLSGNYISLTGFAGYSISTDTLNVAEGKTNDGITSGFALNWGSQRRVTPKIYIDNTLSLEYQSFNGDTDFSDFSVISLMTRSNFGFVLSKKKDPVDFFSEIKVHVNRNYAFRIETNNSFSLSKLYSYSDRPDHWRMLLSPSLISEIKLGGSSFSLVQEVNTVVRFSNIENNVKGSFRATRFRYSVNLGSRYYYKMKKKILKGQGGNDFSGPYVMASLLNRNTSQAGKNKGYVIGTWGWQRELGTRFFIDAGLRLPIKIYGREDPLDFDFLMVSPIVFKFGYRIFGK